MALAVSQKNKKLLGVTLVITIIFLFVMDTKKPEEIIGPPEEKGAVLLITKEIDLKKIEKWVETRKTKSTGLSKLGRILFLNEPEPTFLNVSKQYHIVVWKYGHTTEQRHLTHYTGKRINPFGHCSVKNCDIIFSDKESDDAYKNADIIIFHLHRTQNVHDVPKVRYPHQIWAFSTDESPYHTFLGSNEKLSAFNGMFNWSMTYRFDSDIPVPYGRTLVKDQPDENIQINFNKRRDVLVAMLGSNCGSQNHRWEYIRELQKHIEVHVYGGCGTFKNVCPGHFRADCPAINDYIFYLSFENSNCNEYITEKLWWNAYDKNSIPIVMGTPKHTLDYLLPVDSYIYVDDFANPAALAHYILWINETNNFQRFYDWKANFDVFNEHGYFQSKSYHYCRVCQALNYNTKEEKVYNNLQEYWSVQKDCHPSWDEWKNR